MRGAVSLFTRRLTSSATRHTSRRDKHQLYATDTDSSKRAMSSNTMNDSAHKAAERGDLETLRRLVEVEGVAVDCRGESGNTLLLSTVLPLVVPPAVIGVSYAALSDTFLPMIRYLISKNANVEATLIDESTLFSGYTSLMLASWCGNLAAVQILLAEGRASVNYSTSIGTTALTCATSSPSGLRSVPILLQYGANANPQGTACNVPLMSACAFAATGIARELLEHGANMEAKDGCGRTALHVAVAHSDEATARLLLEHGANANANSQNYYSTPLSIAARDGYITVLQLLLQHNANVDVLFWDMRTILHNVTDIETFRILLDHCRDIMTKDDIDDFLLQTGNDGMLALHCTDSSEIAKLLIEQPRREGAQLPNVCHAQVIEALSNVKYRSQDEELYEYMQTFESLVLAIPAKVAAYNVSSATKRQKTAVDNIAVKLNPALNDFQRSVAQEALGLIIKTTGCPGDIARAILGYLSPLDMMKRSC